MGTVIRKVGLLMIHKVKINLNTVSWYNGEHKKCVKLESQITAFCVLNTKKHIAIAQEQSVFVYTADGVMYSTINIPPEFPNAICINDIYYEESNFTLVLAQYKGYDIACHYDPFTDQLLDWHYTK